MFSLLDNIGFYTLTENRAKILHANLERCEMIVTSFCNFKCPYCRGVEAYSRDCKGHINFSDASFVLSNWIDNNLRNIRFSGGEPTLYPRILDLVMIAKKGKIERIAISTNGSLPKDKYESLLRVGVNDFSISLDACCAEDANRMAGRTGYFQRIIDNIKWLSEQAYVTVGIVLTQETQSSVINIIKFAYDLGVSDIRIITAAQYNGSLLRLETIPNRILDNYPILKYRVNNLLSSRNVRGINNSDCNKCYLVRDDSVIARRWHFPCVIYMREGGQPIGKIEDNMQEQRLEWSKEHNTHKDPICVKNCLDCLVDYNNRVDYYNKRRFIRYRMDKYEYRI